MSRSVPVAQWDDIPIEALQELHGEEIFDSADREERSAVDLETYPIEDEAGLENHIYDVDGMRIPRHEAIIEEGQPVNGMVFDLRRIHELFQKDGMADETGRIDDTLITEHYVYPMAGLRTVGHFQAKGLMTPFSRQLKLLNARIRNENNWEDEDDVEVDLLYGTSALIEGIASQGYNMLSHRVRTAARYHEVQVGTLTAAFSGTYHGSDGNRNKARRFRDICSQALPFERYHQKITGVNVDTSTRVENVYQVDMRRMPVGCRNGR